MLVERRALPSGSNATAHTVASTDRAKRRKLMTKQQRERLNQLQKNWYFLNEKETEEYLHLRSIRNEEYKQENEPLLIAYFEEHIKGRSWSKIDQDRWDFYSDWHKDVYGYRPRTTTICGA